MSLAIFPPIRVRLVNTSFELLEPDDGSLFCRHEDNLKARDALSHSLSHPFVRKRLF
jgi:hypothetical protein